MTLAAILAVHILSFAWSSPSMPIFAGIAMGQQTQAPTAQSPQPAQPQSAPSGQTQNPSNPTPPPKPHKRRKKTVSDCPDSSTPEKPSSGSPNNATNSVNAASANSGSPSPATKPCPPPTKVVRNGGTDEPTIQLTGGTTPAQASQELATTEQLTAFTEDNLKKIADRELDTSQQEIVGQIQQFVDQSKKAVAAGDLERARNLAQKARLLSDELLKP